MARADRPALTPAATGGPPSAESARRAVEAVWRIESARIVGALARYTGDFALAEDVAQEAVAEALVSWSRDGAPANPVGWLLATARRRAIDSFRRRSALDERYAVLAGQLAEGEATSGAVAPPGPADDLPWDPDRIDDDVLALMFVACHPVLSPEARVALTLRAVGGLSSEEIARAFLVPVPTVQARITRAKKTIAAAEVPFELPPADERRERLGGVLSVLYVIFTEGSTATAGDRLLRPDLAYEAIRLARMLAALLPGRAGGVRAARPVRAHGRALPGPHRAGRRGGAAGGPGPAAVGPLGDPPGAGRARPGRGHRAGPRPVRAAGGDRRLPRVGVLGARRPTGTGSCCSTRRSAGSRPRPSSSSTGPSPWRWPSGPQPALAIVDELVASDRLPGSHLLPSVRGELLARLGRTAEARAELELAARLCRNARERVGAAAQGGRRWPAHKEP